MGKIFFDGDPRILPYPKKGGAPPYTGAKSPYFTTKTPYIILNNKANFIVYDTYF